MTHEDNNYDPKELLVCESCNPSIYYKSKDRAQHRTKSESNAKQFPNSNKQEEIILKNLLGKGVQGEAFKCIYNKGSYKNQEACLKIFNNSDTCADEFEMLEAAQASKVVPVLYGGLIYEDGRYCIVMELCKGHTLKEYLKKFNPSRKELHKILYSLMEALGKLH